VVFSLSLPSDKNAEFVGRIRVAQPVRFVTDAWDESGSMMDPGT
jgi:hypothetical protein